MGDELYFPGEPMFGEVRLPGVVAGSSPTQVSLQFGAMLDYAPGGVLFVVEGLGPTDNFRLVGDLTIQPVPETSVWALLGMGWVGWLWLRFRRKARSA